MPSPESPALAPARFDAGETDSAVLGFLRVIAAGEGTLVRWVLGAALLTALFVTVRAPRYTSYASFTPQIRRAPSGAAAGLAAQLGISISSGEAGQSPQFYNELLVSRAILEPIIARPFGVPGAAPGDSAPLYEILDAPGRTSAQRIQSGIRLLRRKVRRTVSIRTGLVSYEVTLGDAAIAHAVSNAMLNELQTFNVTTRQSSAKSERRFTETRAQILSAELRRMEDSLEVFLTKNRETRSPSLAFVQDRLSRELLLRQSLYTQVAQALEQAKIEEVRDTPVLSVVDSPSVPPRRDPRGLIKYSVLAAAVGLLLGLVHLAGARYLGALFSGEGGDATATVGALRSSRLARLLAFVRRR